MVWAATAVIGGAVIGGVASNRAAKKGAKGQIQAAELGMEEERRQFDKVVQLLKPYVEQGNKATKALGNLSGLNGYAAQEEALEGFKRGPQYQTLVQEGEEAILQNASATGGLRGGNTQAALAQFRPQILSQLIEQQFGRLTPIAQRGQASAAGQAAAGQQMASNISAGYADQGAARAGAAIAQGQAISNIGNSIGNTMLLKQFGVF